VFSLTETAEVLSRNINAVIILLNSPQTVDACMRILPAEKKLNCLWNARQAEFQNAP
jgi:hypothetical protein